jgi:hypothetical protein
MAGDGRGLDQLHEGISGRLWQMFREMLEQRRPIPLHADCLDEGFDEAGNVLRALHAIPVTGRHVDDQMFAPHCSLHDDQRFDPRSA